MHYFQSIHPMCEVCKIESNFKAALPYFLESIPVHQLNLTAFSTKHLHL